jgi:hypothetical protein
MLIEAAKYTFYHMSCAHPGARKIKVWMKANVETYLRTCGIAKQLTKEIISVAANAFSLKVDYLEKEGIGTFHFPAAWLGGLSVK